MQNSIHHFFFKYHFYFILFFFLNITYTFSENISNNGDLNNESCFDIENTTIVNSEAPMAVNLHIRKEVNNPNPNPEEIFTYIIKYRCASLTEHCMNTQIQDAIPPDMEIISYTTLGGSVSSAALSGNTITWNLQTPGRTQGQLDAGSTGMVTVKVRFACGSAATTGANPYTNTATISADNGSSSSSSIDVNLQANPPACETIPAPPALLSKYQGNKEWTINAHNSYNIDVPPHTGTYTIVDNIPSQTVVLLVTRTFDYPNLGTYDYLRLRIQCANSGEWFTIFDPLWGSSKLDLASELPAAALECISVPHPDYPNTHYFNITAVEWTIDGAALSGMETISHAIRLSALDTNPFEGLTVNFASGGSGDALPNWTQPQPYGLISNCVTTSEPSFGTACDQRNFSEEASLVALEKAIIGAQDISYPTQPSDFGTPPILNEFANPPITIESNDLVFGLEFSNRVGGLETGNIEVVDLLDPNLEFNPFPSGHNWWHIDVRNSDYTYGSLNPYIIPECWTPTLTIEENWNNTGRTLLRWSFDPACILPANTRETPKIWIYYSTSIKTGTPVDTEIKNMHMAVLPENALLNDCKNQGEPSPEQSEYWADIVDIHDIDLDGDFSEAICRGNVVTYIVPTISDLSSSKWVKGNLDSDFSRYPNIGNTTLTGEGTYEMFIENTGNINVTQLDVVDILPHINDQDVLGVSGLRNSDWRIELENDIILERWNEGTQTWDLVPVGDISGGLQYSTSTNPCRFINAVSNFEDLIADNSAVGPTGCTTTPWGSTAAGANSFGFKFIPSSSFMPGEILKITANVVVNGNPPGCSNPTCTGGGDVLNNGAIAWNSFAFGGIYDDGGSGVRLLDSEPIKVGLKMIDEFNYTSLGNFVWKDLNANGIQEPGEPGIENITVSLWDATGSTKLDSTLTNIDGFYKFYGVATNTTYLIRLDNPIDHLGTLGGWATTLQNDPNGIGDGLDLDDSDASINVDGYPEITAVIGPTTGINNPNDPTEYPMFDFGFYQTNTVGNYVWYDLSTSGDINAEEPSVQGAIVTLYSVGLDGAIGGGDDVQIGNPQTTGSDGLYLFDEVPNGTYYIHFDISSISGTDPLTETPVNPLDWSFTSAFATGDTQTDSNADTNSGFSDIFTLNNGERNLTIDAGIKSSPVAPATIEGLVWADLDNNGLQDIGENPVSNVYVILVDNAGILVSSTYTDGNGEYIFPNLTPNETYQVIFNIESTSTITLQDQGGDDTIDSDVNPLDGTTPPVTPLANETISNIDAGIIIPPFIGDFVWIDADADGYQDPSELGVSGLIVTIHDMDDGGKLVGTAQTNASGYYEFGGYKNVNMELLPYNSNVCINQKITLGDDDAEETKSNGGMSLSSSDLEMTWDGSTEQYIGLRFRGIDIPLGSSINSANIQFSADDDSTPGSNPNTITIKGELATSATGFTVSDYDLSSRTLTTNSAIWNVPAWSTNLERGPNQLTSDMSNVIQEIVNQVGWKSGNNMAFILEGTAEREAEVYNEYPEHAAELIICYDKTLYATQALLSNRNYEIRIAEDQSLLKSYLLTLDNYSGDTSNSPTSDIDDSDAIEVGNESIISLLTGSQSSRNLGFDYGFANKSTISGNAWYDADNNGIREGGELLLLGVTIRLYTSGGVLVNTTSTLGNGYFEFLDVLPGDYYISFDDSSNKNDMAFISATFQEVNGNSNIDDALDSDIDPNTKESPIFNVGLGENRINIDAGFVILPLPVELIEFKGIAESCSVHLKWSTASEENNSHFIVEYSIDGEHFEPIGYVEGNGTTLETQSYSFTHDIVRRTYNYYRLKQVDYDNSYEYSETLLIQSNCEQLSNEKILVYPNPTSDIINLEIMSETEGIGEFFIVDVNGKVLQNDILNLNEGITIKSISLQKYISGLYIIIFKDDKGYRKSFNIAKVEH